MKIVKQFESNEYAIKRSGKVLPNYNPFWIWGIGDDGVLYAKGQIAGYHYIDNWKAYHYMSFGIPIEEMVKIVKEFGHLLVML